MIVYYRSRRGPPHGGAAGPASAPRAQPWRPAQGARRAATEGTLIKVAQSAGLSSMISGISAASSASGAAGFL